MEAVQALVTREGGQIVSEYREIESGKSHLNRPALAQALAECKRRKAILVIAKLDRLARNVHFISGLMESGAEFRACDNPNATKLTLHILAAVAEHERETISNRIKDALRQKKKELEEKGEGQRLGNPDWHASLQRAHEKTRAPLPSDEVMGFIERHRAEKLSGWSKPIASYSYIAKQLNAKGWKTHNNKPWHGSTVRAMALRIDEWKARKAENGLEN
jgi:DNA invertase Pin-like site-specific DNA recombinase